MTNDNNGTAYRRRCGRLLTVDLGGKYRMSLNEIFNKLSLLVYQNLKKNVYLFYFVFLLYNCNYSILLIKIDNYYHGRFHVVAVAVAVAVGIAIAIAIVIAAAALLRQNVLLFAFRCHKTTR
jgi:hypothetical protein